MTILYTDYGIESSFCKILNSFLKKFKINSVLVIKLIFKKEALFEKIFEPKKAVH